MPTRETLAQLVARVLPTRYTSVRDADRNSDVTYGTWQNVTLRDTIPTFETLTKIAAALDLPEEDILTAARVSQAARDLKRQTASGGGESPAAAAKKRAQRGTRSTKRSPRRPAE